MANLHLEMLVTIAFLREATTAERALVGSLATVQLDVVLDVAHLCEGLVAGLALEQLPHATSLRRFHLQLLVALLFQYYLALIPQIGGAR